MPILKEELDEWEDWWNQIIEFYLCGVEDANERLALLPPARCMRAVFVAFCTVTPFALALGDARPRGGIDAPAVWLAILYGAFIVAWMLDIGLLLTARRHMRRKVTASKGRDWLAVTVAGAASAIGALFTLWLLSAAFFS